MARYMPPELDFMIIGIARSGTHMLASALNSHPDIVCFGEYEKAVPLHYDWLGGVVKAGHMVGALMHNPAPKYVRKVIHISRPPEETVKSMQEIACNGVLHTVRGGDLPDKKGKKPFADFNFLLEQRDEQARLRHSLKGRDYFLCSYAELCACRDAVTLNRVTTDDLCRFLGVDPLPLNPLTMKVRSD